MSVADRSSKPARGSATLTASWLQRPWGRQRVWRAGRGPVVLAIHGLGGSGRYWEKLAQHLDETHTVLAPDLAGFGQSDKPNVAYDRGFHLDNLDAVVDGIAPSEPVVVVGHSVGAILAALWAARRPERVAALVLVAAPFPGLRPFPAPARWVRHRPRSPSRRIPIALIRSVALTIAIPLALLRGYPPRVVRDFTRQSLQGRAGTMWSLMADGEAADELAALRELPEDVEVLLITGSSDRWTAARDIARWTALLPRAQALVWNGGHQLLLRDGVAPLARWIASRQAARCASCPRAV